MISKPLFIILRTCFWLKTLTSFNRNSSSARFCYIFHSELAQKKARAEPSRAGRPLARAECELSRAELSSGASLIFMTRSEQAY